APTASIVIPRATKFLGDANRLSNLPKGSAKSNGNNAYDAVARPICVSPQPSKISLYLVTGLTRLAVVCVRTPAIIISHNQPGMPALGVLVIKKYSSLPA